jgi:hypothetical protein
MGTLVQDAQQHILVDKYSISNPTCHLLALLGAHHILHVSRVRVKYLSNFPLKTSNTKFHEDLF